MKAIGRIHLEHTVLTARGRGHTDPVAVYLAWTDVPVALDTPGPWHELRQGPPGVVLVDSDDRQSRVFHELKWALPENSALFVTRLDTRPKLKNMPDGTLKWLRVRLPLPD